MSLSTPPIFNDDTFRSGIAPNQWEKFDRDGWVVLPAHQVFPDLAELKLIQSRLDDIMMGTADVPYDRMLMQLDSSTGRYEDAGPQTLGHKGATLAYRKIQNLDFDPVIMNYCRKNLFRKACNRVYGDIPISSFRTMFFNKPAHAGTSLPWHQDRWKYLSKDPILNAYLALDEANPDNGCLKIITKSHHRGVINAEHHSAFLDEEQIAEHCPPVDPEGLEVDLILKPGEVALMHNWVIHKSGTNSTDKPRRALSISFMDSNTTFDNSIFQLYHGGDLKSSGYPEGGTTYPIIFSSKEQRNLQKVKKILYELKPSPVVHLPKSYKVLDLESGFAWPEDPGEICIGRYNEKRMGMYETPLFKSGDASDERNVHIGIDFGGPAMTPCYSPLDSVVLHCGYNPASGDYGNCIVLETSIGNTDLYLLYGHLSASSLEGKVAGMKIEKGSLVGFYGERDENGGWPPHLHFQISFEKPATHDMPGVVSEKDRELALEIYPDPRILIGPVY